MAVIEEVEEAEDNKEDDNTTTLTNEVHNLSVHEGASNPGAEFDADAIEPEFDMVRAQDAKALGNTRYAAGEWQLAADAYTEAIMWVPPDAEEKAVYHCNRAACFIKTGQREAVVDDCTAALEIQPRYAKALARRAQAYEELDKLTEAVADAKLVEEIEATSQARANVVRLEKKEAEKLEREKEEMLGKLKDLGNMFLGNFGMSLNNFKATKDENTGSYNIAYEPGTSAP